MINFNIHRRCTGGRQRRPYAVMLIMTIIFLSTCQSVAVLGASADDLYYEGQQALDDNNWQAAQTKFQTLLSQADSESLKQGTNRVDSALYWLSYALHKGGDSAAALESLKRLTKDYPNSTWADEARQLSDDIQGRSNPDAIINSDELQLTAISGLVNAPAERVVPILREVIFSDRPDRLKERALFVLSQKNSAAGNQLMAEIVVDEKQPQLQRKAIHMMALAGGQQALAVLTKLYSETNNIETRHAILKALGPADAVQELATIIASETDPDLVKEAIRSLGIAGNKATPILETLYRTSISDPEKRKTIVRSLAIADGHRVLQVLIEETNDQTPDELVIELIKAYGIADGSQTFLTSMYNRFDSFDIRRQIIEALFISDNAEALINIIKNETNRELRQKAVRSLSHMDNQDATEYLIDIIQTQ